MKIYTVVGARPNFIKIDPDLPQTIVHTGQHYDYKMSETFFEGLKLPKPKYNLGCTDIGQMTDKLANIFKMDKPDFVLVFGDTNSSLAGALAASQHNIPIAHVEAGLRSGDMRMPEEKNRVLIDRIARLKFCPNTYSELNLRKEGIKDDIFVVGDPMFDTLFRSTPIKKTKNYREYSLLTLHRNFNADNKDSIQAVFDAIEESTQPFVFPVHPRTRKNIRKFKIRVPANLKLKSPVAYKPMLSLISNAKRVLTDSGGVQKEAFWMNVPVIILRDSTEWLEIVDKKAGILVGTDKVKIKDAIASFKGTLNPPPMPGVNRKIKEILYKYA